MDLQLINKLLKNLSYPDQKVLKLIQRDDVKTPIKDNGEGEQGEENVFVKIYQSTENPTVYIKVEYFTDSYGYGSFVRGVQFVQPTQKTVTVFE